MGRIIRKVMKPQPSGKLEALVVLTIPLVAVFLLIQAFVLLGSFVGVCVTLGFVAIFCVMYIRQLRVKWYCSCCGHTLAGPVRVKDSVELPVECPNCRELVTHKEE